MKASFLLILLLLSISKEATDYSKTIEDYIAQLMKSTPDNPLWNIEVLTGKQKKTWNYIDGCMMNALVEMYSATQDSKYIDYAKDFVDFYVNDSGEVTKFNPENYNLDDLSFGRVFFDLYDYTKKEKYRKAQDLFYSQILIQPRTEEGNFWHQKVFKNQVWLDGLYMAQPFYTRYQTAYKSSDYTDIINQIQNVYDIMFDKEKKLYYHGYDSSRKSHWADKETGLSKSFWLRAEGWFAAALVDVYSYMDKSKEKEREIIKEIFIETINGILQYQDEETKMFWQVIDYPNREGNYVETSGSSQIAYAILKAARLGIIDESYSQIGAEIFQGICDKYLNVDDDGEISLGGICIAAGLGLDSQPKVDGSYEYYISTEVVENDAKGVGFFISAYAEMLRLNKN